MNSSDVRCRLREITFAARSAAVHCRGSGYVGGTAEAWDRVHSALRNAEEAIAADLNFISKGIS